jgi:protein-S-isoprenylcysteine O-methyltransferase Ste14
LLSLRKIRCITAAAGNALLVCLPALVMGGVDSITHAAIAIFITAMCEGLATSPYRVARLGADSRLAISWNLAHGVAVLICLQSFTVLSLTGEEGDDGWRLFGALLLGCGVALRTAAICTLGVNFGDGFTPITLRRVRSGPYRFLRHPAELGLLIIIGGFGTLVRGWSITSAAVFALVTAGSIARVAWEEIAFDDLSITSGHAPSSN